MVASPTLSFLLRRHNVPDSMQFILFNFVKLLTLDYVLSPIYNYHHIYSGDESLRVVVATSVFVNIDHNNKF